MHVSMVVVMEGGIISTPATARKLVKFQDKIAYYTTHLLVLLETVSSECAGRT